MELDVKDKWRYTKLGELPLVGQEVLVFVFCGRFFSIGYISSGEWYLEDSMYYNLDEDIAWRPLPEEPKEI